MKGATYISEGWIWTGSCVVILPSHTVRQVCGSECRDFSFDMCIIVALTFLYNFLKNFKYFTAPLKKQKDLRVAETGGLCEQIGWLNKLIGV